MPNVSNKAVTSVAEWKATFLPNAVTEDPNSDVPSLTVLAHAAAIRAIDQVKKKPQSKRRSAPAADKS
ncbi:hypothetical protein KPA93_20350 [Burkholderia cenocepacia]|uniref:hypothetical protein n=1 Tax=Burkholderia cenocepacia TaxID=95486 RepID=UPI00285E9C67|nr:hypothetical protein [Burkholderia cenocepacia]MDR8025600.1 hypothetical protein [Burkholderia cenocepacia]MDR8042840.1 hypothetical protein [Burkholderia cenocepacia]